MKYITGEENNGLCVLTVKTYLWYLILRNSFRCIVLSYKICRSGRATLRNRNFLRVYTPLHSRRNPVSDFNSEIQPAPPSMILLNHPRLAETPNVVPTQSHGTSPGVAAAPHAPPPPGPDVVPAQPRALRRSSRIRKPTQFFVPGWCI